MIKIAFVCNWGNSPLQLLDRYKNQTKNSDGIWDNLIGIANPEAADFIIILDGLPKENFRFQKKSKFIYFQREPSEINPYAGRIPDNTNYIGTYDDHFHLATWQIKKPLSFLSGLESPKKNKKISAIVSSKNQTFGQKKRLELISLLSQAYPHLDVYGRGFNSGAFNDSYKGELNYDGYCKYAGLINYEYSIAIENSTHKNYFTEKIIDCFLTLTKPIYWGCQNINEYFPSESFTQLDINQPDALSYILEEIKKPVDYEALKEARDLVLYKYNLWAAIKILIDNLESAATTIKNSKENPMKNIDEENKEVEYYSQIGQDKIIDCELLDKKRNGFFVEVRAADGYHSSNSLFFERHRGWEGICIEPNPIEFNKLLNSDRICLKENYAISSEIGDVEFLSIDGYGIDLSGIISSYDSKHLERIDKELLGNNSTKKIVKVKSISLQEIFDKHDVKYVDYCSIEVEGAGLQVLQSIDFLKTMVLCFSIGNNYGDEEVTKYLEEKGYILWKKVEWDSIYLLKKEIEKRKTIKICSSEMADDADEEKRVDEEFIKLKLKPHFYNLLPISEGALHKSIDPLQILSYKRFDVAAKYIYVKFKEKYIDSRWGLEIYDEHLRVFNNYKEGDGTGKEGLAAFVASFNNTIDSLKQNGFDSNQAMIPISKNDELIEGAHRVAASIYLKNNIEVLAFNSPGWEYDYKFFASRGLNSSYGDAIAFEFCKLKNNAKMVMLFPSADGKDAEVEKILKKYGGIFYRKDIYLTQKGSVLLMSQIYKDEQWLGSMHDGFRGAQHKAAECFKSTLPLCLFVFDPLYDADLIAAKDEIRALYNIGKHSVHINDRHDETLNIAKILLNDNSIHFLNNADPKIFTGFSNNINKYKNSLKNSGCDSEYFCVGGSAVMAMYGIRDAQDVDYLHYEKNLTVDKDISSHNKEIAYYPTTRDDIIFNPLNHFYFDGIKFASLEVIKKLKKKRGEEKDKRDINLVNNFLSDNSALQQVLHSAEENILNENNEAAKNLLLYALKLFPYNSDIINNLAIVEFNENRISNCLYLLLMVLSNDQANEIANENWGNISDVLNLSLPAPNSLPDVSVIIPCYNQSEYLPDAIRSLDQQYYKNIECIIVNDGSGDSTIEIANSLISKYKNLNLILLNKQNGGLADARNFGIQAAKGKYILPLDADDTINPNFIIKCMAHLLADPNASIAYTDTIRFGEVNNTYQTAEWDTERLKYQNILNYCSLYKKDVWLKNRGYNRNMIYGYEDWDFWIGAAKNNFKGIHIPEYLFHYRIRIGSMLAKAVEKDEILKARIRLNHTSIYPADEVESAKKILKKYLLNLSSKKEEILLKGINTEKKKILFVVHNFPPYWYAGVENYAYQLAKQFIENNNDVSVVYPVHNAEMKTPQLMEKLFDSIHIYEIHHKLSSLEAEINDENIYSIFNEILKEKFDVVHFHHTKGLPYTIIKAAKNSGAKTAVTLHDFWLICPRYHLFDENKRELCSGPDSAKKCSQCLYSNNSNSDYEKFIEHRQNSIREIFDYIDIKIAPSKFVANKYKEYGYDDIIVSHLGFESIICEKKKSSQIRFGYIGSISPVKNVLFLAESFSKTKGDAEFSFYGNGMTTEISSLLEIIKKDNRMKYKGDYKPSDLPDILSGIDIAVIPSIVETFSFTVREAISAGVPVLASNGGALPEAVDDGKNGLIFNLSDNKDLLKNLQLIIRDKNILKKIKPDKNNFKTISQDAFGLIRLYEKIRTKKVAVSIIIPVFNKVDLTKNCLNSIYKYTRKTIPFEIIVVDNKSSDDTLDFLKDFQKDHSELVIISNEENLGFAKANNIGAANAKGKYLLLLNNDTEVQPGWLENLYATIDSNDSIGAVGSKLLFPNGTIQHAGVIIINDQLINDPLVARHIFYGQQADYPEANQATQYKALTAACLMIRKDVFARVNGFDENYWNGYEDVDLCFKIFESGYKLIYQPKSIVTHYESQSGKERFTKVNENIILLHKKWLNKIEPDFLIEKDGSIKSYAELKHHNKFTSIITLTFNGLKYTKELIESIQKNTAENYELIIVDNASSDDTIEYLKELEKNHNNFKIIFNKKNLGFPAGINQGINQASGDYLLIVNNDVVVTKNWLKRMIQVAESNPQIGMVGPISNYVSGVQLDKGAKYKSISEMNSYAKKISKTNKGQILEFPRVAFLCTLIKKEVTEKLGGLDEIFTPGNFEDDDYCLRAQLSGFKTVVAKDVFIHHHGSKSFKASGEKQYGERLKINKKKFIDKWGADPEEIWIHGKSFKNLNVYLPIENQSSQNKNEENLLEFSKAEITKGIDYLLLNDRENAKASFEKALSLDPESSDACCGLGEILFLEENYEAAKTMFEWALKFDNKNRQAIDRLNEIRLSNSPNADITGELNEIISSIKILIENERFEDALNILIETKDLFNSPGVTNALLSDYYSVKGFVLIGLNDLEAANENFETALYFFPESSEGCRGLAELFYLAEMLDEANTMIEWSLKYDPENKKAALLSGKTLNNISNSEKLTLQSQNIYAR
jgi:GT2 family glycosyltransferase/glycosyltransferase involved in cell wall biosynthesis